MNDHEFDIRRKEFFSKLDFWLNEMRKVAIRRRDNTALESLANWYQGRVSGLVSGGDIFLTAEESKFFNWLIDEWFRFGVGIQK